jgi:hypothetical protein
MGQVWVQVWTARVAGSVSVEESELRKVAGLESVSKLIPMLVKETDLSGWEMVPNWGKQLVSVEELVEVLEPSDLRKVQELELRMARAKVAELEKAYPLGKDWA